MEEQDYIEIKVRIGNLLNCFSTNKIRKKDMVEYNKKLNNVVKFIEDKINKNGSGAK